MMAEHERVLEQLYEHQVMTGGDPVVEVVHDVVVGAVEGPSGRASCCSTMGGCRAWMTCLRRCCG
ncbi:MAG: hypothetical protein JWP46_912 [Modestobacter sp.]|nr:hypothetical protein [Modestobacter sp.]